jgi:hypothetical protein
MPPAFVLSQDQTLRLTSRSPANEPNQARRPETQNQDPVTSRAPTAKDPVRLKPRKSRPSTNQSPSSAQETRQATGPSGQAKPSQEPPPAHPFSSHQQCQTASLHRSKTSKVPRPDLGPCDPPRPVGAVPTIKRAVQSCTGPTEAGMVASRRPWPI